MSDYTRFNAEKRLLIGKSALRLIQLSGMRKGASSTLELTRENARNTSWGAKKCTGVVLLLYSRKEELLRRRDYAVTVLI